METGELMKKLILKAIFLFIGLMMNIVYRFDYSTCLFFIISLIFTCLLEIIKSNSVSNIIKVSFIILCIFTYELNFYLCLWMFDSYDKHHPFFLSMMLIPFIQLIIFSNNYLVAFMPILMVIAAYLKNEFTQYEEMSMLYKSQRDSMIENQLLLEEKNKSLLREKEYEIQIATLNERNRIARDIHDNIGHVLSSSLLQVGAIKIINKQENMNEFLIQLQHTLENGMENARKSVHDLYDTSIDFKLEIEKLIEEFQLLPIDFSYTISSKLDTKTISHVLSILSEGLFNIKKHAKPSIIKMILNEQAGFYQVILINDGVIKAIQETGIGLKNIKSRVHELNGNINITCQNKEFKIFIMLPKENLNENINH